MIKILLVDPCNIKFKSEYSLLTQVCVYIYTHARAKNNSVDFQIANFFPFKTIWLVGWVLKVTPPSKNLTPKRQNPTT